MKMKTIAIILLLATGECRCPAQEPALPAESNTRAAELEPLSPDLVAIRDASKLFIDAFNKQDASAVAAMWTKDGEYVDGAGRVIVGRTAIEKDYMEFFVANPGAKIEIEIDSLRLLTGDTAIEDGRAAIQSPTGEISPLTKYTVVHAKVNGQWLMASVREAFIETPAAVTTAADLEWLIGTWVAEEHGVKTKSVCTWVVEGRFIEREYSTTQADGTTTTGLQLIGWNPKGGHVQSWSFSPEGGHAVGIWSPQRDGWSAQMRGVAGDGTLTTAINQLRRLDDNAHVWQSIQRTAGGLALPDTDEVIFKRQPIAP